jgi:RHS repeat-associated protein
MEFSLPLPSYLGRGGNSLPNSIEYSSKVWGAGTPGRYRSSNGTVVVSIHPRFGERSTAGWTASLAVPMLDEAAHEIYFDNGDGATSLAEDESGGGSNQYVYYIKRYHLIMPDGSTHELRADDAKHSFGTEQNPGYPAGDSRQIGTYLSTDGTRMRLEWNQVGGVWRNTLYLPDGSRYLDLPSWQTSNPTGYTTYIDRNGNKMLYNNSTKQWTDTLGRTLQSPFTKNSQSPEPAATTQTLSYPGADSNSAQQVQLVWAKLDTQQTTLSYLSEYYCSGSSRINIPAGNSTLFSGLVWGPRVCGGNTPFNPVVLTEVRLPNGTKYKFHYNVYGEIDRIDYPTGGYERFVYAQITPIASTGEIGYDQFNRGVKDRYVSETGTTAGEVHWGYDVERETTSTTQGPYRVKTFAPDGTWSEQLLTDRWQSYVARQFGFDNGTLGRAYEERVYSKPNPATAAPTRENSVLLRRKLTKWKYTGPVTVNGVAGESSASRDLRPEKEISIIFEPNESSALATMTETIYDTDSVGESDPAYFSKLNPKQVKTYNYLTLSSTNAKNYTFEQISPSFTSSNLARINQTDYLYNTNYKGRNITGLVSGTSLRDAANNIKAQSELKYDETSYPVISSGTSSTWQDPNTNYRGNVTTTRVWNNTNGSWIETHAQYDNFGNLRRSWDGNHSSDINKYTATDYSSDYDYAYPTKVTTLAPGTNQQTGATAGFETSTVYNYNTGLPTSTTDANNLKTVIEYDAFMRPFRATPRDASNNVVGAITETYYGVPNSTTGQLAAGQRFAHTKTQIDSANWAESWTWFDGLGRTIKTQKKDSAGDVFVETHYDEMGRADKTTNPYRAGTADADKKWTTYVFDDLSRIKEVLSPLEAGQSTPAKMQTGYSLSTTSNTLPGTVVTATDQAGKQRRSVTNALGQLQRVDEPKADTGELDINGNPYQSTVYEYDLLGNLKTVTQGAQTRSFVYDSLSRLKSATNPEMGTTPTNGTIYYNYDNNGNLTSKTDPRGIVTTYNYDNLNRVLSRIYSNEPSGQAATPAANYYYDNLTNAKGKLIKVITGSTSSPFSVTDYQSFDILGRVTQSQQTTDGTAYNPMTYTYNLSGALIEQKYPSGRVVKNVLDADGDLSIVQSKKNANSGFWNYASHFSYTVAGAVSSMQLGNGRWESTQFNNRLQPVQIALGATQNATNLLKLDFNYGTTDNNGNVKTQTITVPSTAGQNNGFTATQTYNYDSLNRLKDASETIGTQTWKQTYKYDRFGNREFDAANTTTLGSCPQTICNPSINTADNRFNTGQGYSYDNAGNLKTDAEGKQFTYDADNKQTEVKNQYSQSIGTYFYDADGRRVKKVVPSTGETTIFVYDAAGKLVAEYSTIVETTNAKVGYLTQDHLGSPRIVTDRNGNVSSRRDFLPFGEEIGVNIPQTAGRSVHPQYVGDNTRQKFTGYERDGESELDYAQARYYNSKQGRFTTPDEPFADQDESDPQTWNLFTYARNNPIHYTDPTGRGILDRIKNLFKYGYFVENDRLKEIEQETRDWLQKNIYQQDKDGNWHPVDASKLNTDQVFDAYWEIKGLQTDDNPNNDLYHLTLEEAASALNVDPVTLTPKTTPGSTNSTPPKQTIKFNDPVSKLSLRGKTLTSGSKTLRDMGLKERITRTGRHEFYDPQTGKVRAAYDAANSKGGNHWHKFAPDGQTPLNNAGRVVEKIRTSAHIPSK